MLIWAIAQAILFQIFWFVAVIGQNHWLWLLASLLVAHIALSPSWVTELKIMPLSIFGIAIDTIFALMGIFQFSQFPVWLGMLWLMFAVSLGHSLKWLGNLELHWQALVGSLAGITSYLAGWKLEAVALPYGPVATAILLAIIWACLLPVLVKLDSSIRSSTTSSTTKSKTP